MRSVVMLVVGLVIGAVCTTMALRALNQGSEYPQGVMALMGVHLGAVRKAVEAGRCEAGEMARHAATLRLVAHDIEPAFLAGGDEPAFAAHAVELRQAAGALEQAAGAGCAALSEAAASVGRSCKACHQEFR